MSDHYIDQYETLSYGPFAVGQIQELVVGTDKHFDSLLKYLADQLTAKTKAMRTAIDKAGGVEKVTYLDAKGSPVEGARDVLRRGIAYASSHKNGDAMVAQILGHLTPSAIGRARPIKLAGMLESASKTFKGHEASLGSEGKTWIRDLDTAHEALASLNHDVKNAREERKSLTPELKAAHAGWLTSYGAAKLVVEAVLRLHGKESLLPSVFDDLAEVHHAKGVHDDPGAAARADGGSQPVAAAPAVAAASLQGGSAPTR